MARPNKGLGHVDGLKGDEESKYQLKLVLATLTGEMLVEEAYEELCVGPTQFAHLRKRVLQGALDALEPRSIGRPKRVTTKTDEEVLEMEERIKDLEHELQVVRARIELSVLPLLQKVPKKQGRTKAASEAPPP